MRSVFLDHTLLPAWRSAENSRKARHPCLRVTLMRLTFGLARFRSPLLSLCLFCQPWQRPIAIDKPQAAGQFERVCQVKSRPPTYPAHPCASPPAQSGPLSLCMGAEKDGWRDRHDGRLREAVPRPGPYSCYMLQPPERPLTLWGERRKAQNANALCLSFCSP